MTFLSNYSLTKPSLVYFHRQLRRNALASRVNTIGFTFITNSCTFRELLKDSLSCISAASHTQPLASINDCRQAGRQVGRQVGRHPIALPQFMWLDILFLKRKGS